MLNDDVNEDIFENVNYKKWKKEYESKGYSIHPLWNLEYDSGWMMKMITDLQQNIDKEFKKSVKKFHFNKNQKEERLSHIFSEFYPEQKLHAMLGEFVFFSARHLLNEDFQNFLKDINLEGFGRAQIPFNAIKVAPKGYPVSGHYVFKTTENPQEMKSVWGLRFEDEALVAKKVYVHKKQNKINKNQP
jgi:hypothetical protein